VVIREGDPAINFTDAVVSGSAPYGINNSDLLIERNAGKKIVVPGVIFQHSPLIMLSRADSALPVPSDYVGRSVMISGDAEAEILSIFRNESVPLDAVRFQPHSWDLEDLIQRRTDAVSAYSTNELITMKLSGIEANAIRPLTYGIDFCGDCLFTSEKEIERHPKRAAAFLRASVRGWEYAMTHPEELSEPILDRYSTRKTKIGLLLEAEAMKELIVPKLVPIGFMNPGRWCHIGDTYVALGALDPAYTLDGFLYDPDKPLFDPLPMRIGLAILGAAAFASILYIAALRSFNRNLAREVRARTERLEAEIERGTRRERKIAASLAEKGVLLKEIHHRVKNNLQVIVSINLQSEGKEPSFFRELKNRVLGMALVHEYLYAGSDLAQVDMDDYLRRLVTEIVVSYSRSGLYVRAEVCVENVALAMDQAIPLGLIVTELVSNGMKHVYRERESGTIEISLLREADRCRLSFPSRQPAEA